MSKLSPKTLIVKFTLLFIVFFVAAIHAYSQHENLASSTKFKVKFHETASKSNYIIDSKSISKTKSGIVLTGIKSIDELNQKYLVKNLKRVFPYAGEYEQKHIKHGLHLWYEFEIVAAKSNEITNCIKSFEQNDLIEISEPYYTKQIIGYTPGSAINTPVNDTRFNQQWHYHNTGQTSGTVDADIDLPEAWQIEAGSDNVIVAIIDGGVDYNHADLSGAMWTNSAELNGTTGVDDDGNGYIDDIHGYGFGDNIGNFNPHEHGTHVGGTVGATNNNGVGVCGIAGGNNGSGGVRLMSCATFGSYGQGGFDVSFVYAADNGAVISQNSWGYTSSGYYEQSVLDAIDYFIANAGYDANGNAYGPMQGGLVIFAAGNSGNSGAHYPAYYPPCLAVASTNHNDQRSWYSNYGTWVDIAAPGGETNITTQGVLSTLPNNSYGFFQGTSMACPHVSGVAALIVSKYGGNGLTPTIVRNRLTETTDDIDALNSNYAGLLGSGRLNAFKALLEDDGIAPNPIKNLSITGNGTISVDLQWTATGFSADSGAATAYDLRYANFEINESNFNSATKVRNIIPPAMVGTTETFELTGLTPETTYWFAIKATDYFGNISTISNVVSVTTDQAPIIAFNPKPLIHSIDSGIETTISGNILNLGSIDLAFSIPPISQVTSTLVNNTSFIAFNQKLEKDMPDTRMGHPVLTGSGNDGDHGFGYRWIDSNDPNGPTFNWIDIRSTGTSISMGLDDSYQINLPFSFPFYGQAKNSVNISSNGFLTFNSRNADAYVNEQIPEQSFPNDLIAFMWDDFDARQGGTIHYYTDASKLIVQFTDIKRYSTTYKYTFQVILYRSGAIKMQYHTLDRESNSCTIGIENADGREGMQIAFNTNYLHDNLAIQITPPISFIIDASPTSGNISSGSSQQVTFTVNSFDLSPNNYFDSVAVESNDPLKETAYYPIQLHVNGIPKIDINTDSISFDTIFVDVRDSLPIKITNNGTDSLFISDISIQDDLFSLSPDLSEIKLYNSEEKTIYVYFNPQSNLAYYDTLELLNNTSNSLVRIPLYGYAIHPPFASINPKTFNYNLTSGDSVEGAISIDNTLGQSELYYEIEDVFFNENENIQINQFNLKNHSLESVQPDVNNKTMVNSQPIITNSLNNLNGTTIGAFDFSDMTIVRSDIEQRGGTIKTLYSPLTAEQLKQINTIILDDNIAGLTSVEISLIRNFVANGSSLAVFADNSGSINYFSQLFANTGISPNSHNFGIVNLTSFTDHPTTKNISQIHCPATGYSFNTTLPAKAIGYDENGICRYAVSKFGSGKVVAFCNENLYNSYMDAYDNRLFANQLIDWLCGTTNGWLSISTEPDTVQAGQTKNHEFMVRTTNMLAGKYQAKACFTTNAPNLLTDTITINLNLTGHPVLATSVDTISFDSVFVGIEYTNQVNLSNIGTDTLFITSISTTTNDAAVDTSILTLMPNESYSIKVTYLPSVNGIFNHSIVIASNDTSGLNTNIKLIGKAYLPPVCNVAGDTIKAELYSGLQKYDSIQITNAGGTDLTYKIKTIYKSKVDTTFPELNAIGDFHKLISTPTYLTGMVTEKQTGYIYAVQRNNNVLYQYNPYDSTWMNISISPNYFGSYSKSIILNNKIYIGTRSSSLLSIYDLANGSWSTISTNFSHTCFFETDGIELFFFSYSDFKSFNPTNNQWTTLNANSQYFDYDGSASYYNHNLYVQNGSGNFFRYNLKDKTWHSLARPINSTFYGSAIDPSTETLYAYYNTTLYKYSIKTNLWTSESIPNFQGRYSGITYNAEPGIQGIYFSEGGSGYDFVRYETKNTYHWLTVNNLTDTIKPNESKYLKLHFDANDLTEAQYRATININSNDPKGSIRNIPVCLNVRNAAILSLSDDSLLFENTYIGFGKQKNITVSNNGTDTLIINNIAIDNNQVFSISKNNLVIAPDSSKTITITANMDVVDTIESHITFYSNAKPIDNATVYVKAIGRVAPNLQLPEQELSTFSLPNQIRTETFSVCNTGGSELYYEISGGEILSFDSTSTKYFSNSDEDTYHVFNKNYTGNDSITISVTLNGYYQYSWAYAELEIEGINHGIINDGDMPIGTNCTANYTFPADSASKWFADNKLEIYLRNTNVSAGYGESKNQVRLKMDGVEWFALPDTNGFIAVNDTLLIDATFDASGFKAGNYYSSFIIKTNDPDKASTKIPVTLKVRDQEAPFVKKPQSDIVHYITEENATIDFSEMFFDVNYDELTYTVNSNNVTSVFATNNGTKLNLKLLSPGSSLISINASDNNFAPVTSQFNVLVLNNSPVTASASTIDTTVYLNTPAFNVNLANYFTDNDNDKLSFNVTTGSDSLVLCTLDSTILNIVPNKSGVCFIKVTAYDGKNTQASQNFQVNIIENLPPVIANKISNVSIFSTDSLSNINLDTVFTDPDNDTIYYSITISDSSILIPSLEGNTLSYMVNGTGVATITITATDSITHAVKTSFTIEITENHAPVVINSISDIITNLEQGNYSIDLTKVFSDAENDSLIYTISTSSNVIASWKLTDSILNIKPLNIGSVNFVLIACDNKSEQVTTDFYYEVQAINQSPIVINTIERQEVFITQNLAPVSIENIFSDPDGDSLSYTISSSDSSKVITTLNGNKISFSLLAADTVTISLKASDGISAITETIFNVVVLNNHLPHIADSIKNQTISLSTASKTINLNTHFNDADGDKIFYSISSNNDTITSWAFNDSVLVILPLKTGTNSFTVTASDNKGLATTQKFNITVTDSINLNNAPVVLKTINDITVYLNDIIAPINLRDIFYDADNDPINYLVHFEDSNIVKAHINFETLNFDLIGGGSGQCTVFAYDKSDTVSTSFNISVIINYPPELIANIENIEVTIDTAKVTLNLNNYFTDANNDAITYRLEADNNGIVDWHLTDSTLIFYPLQEGSASFMVFATDNKSNEISDWFNFTINKPVGINSNENAINIFPNPVSSMVTINYNLHKPANVQVKLYSLKGALVLSKDLGFISNTLINESIDLSTLNKSVYNIQLIIDGTNIIQKTIIKD